MELIATGLFKYDINSNRKQTGCYCLYDSLLNTCTTYNTILVNEKCPVGGINFIG